MALVSSSLARSMLAAARLAVMYTSGVILLLLALLVTVGGVDEVLRELAGLALPLGICLGIAFVVLAVARRAGFSTLWLAALTLWAWLALRERYHGPRPGPDFVLWTVLAAPLYGMVRLGFGSPVGRTARRRAAAVAFAVGWGALAVAGVLLEYWPPEFFDPGRPELALVRGALEVLWRTVPVAVTGMALWRVHRPDALAAPPA